MSAQYLASRKKRKRLWLRPEASGGSLGEISELFIKPLLQHRPETWSLARFLNFIFHTNERLIQEFTAVRRFSIPGKYRILPTRSVEGYGYREIRCGCPLWMRVDTRSPDRIEVETTNAIGQKQQLFLLTAAEWKSILPHLYKVGKRRKKKPPRPVSD